MNKVWFDKPCSKILGYLTIINFQNENPIGSVDIHIFAFSFTLVGVCLSPKILSQLTSLLCYNLVQKPKVKVVKRINLITFPWRKHSFSFANWSHFLPQLLRGEHVKQSCLRKWRIEAMFSPRRCLATFP